MFLNLKLNVKRGVVFLMVTGLISPPSHADYDQGVQAWEAGRYRQAVAEWLSAANAEDGLAMLELGRAYATGLGVIQDWVEAHKWFNLAAAYGIREGVQERDALEALMSDDERAEARNLAQKWVPEGDSEVSSPPVAEMDTDLSASPGLPPEAVRETQALLKALGYRPGPVDGVWGLNTLSAYRGFLRDAGLPISDTPSPEVLSILREIAASQGIGPVVDLPTVETAPPPALAPDALHRAAVAGNLEALKAALEAGAEIDRRDGQGWTALMHAVNQGYILVVESLSEAGADLDARAPDGATALFMAAVLEQPEIIKQLVDAGADITIPGPKGRTAVDVARLSFEESLVFQMFYAVRDCAVCPEMVVVPPGSFKMGSNDGDDDEQPMHKVTIPHPLAVGKYEITFSEWDACVSEGGCSHRPADEGWGRGNRPVIDVSWEDVQEYVRWLSGRTGQGYRLLSEAEWEYVARAGTQTEYHTGDRITTDQANFDGDVYREQTVPVGSFPANDFGLHDVHGNVWEWVEDCYHERYDGAPTDGSAWTTGACDDRVLRGGDWSHDPEDLRSALRIGFPARFRNYYIGFRVARTLAP